MPYDADNALRNAVSAIGSKPSLSMPMFRLDESRMRSTAFSPWMVGRIDTRKSTWRPSYLTWNLPSWGTRRSAMSRDDMILMREIMEFDMDFGGMRLFFRTSSRLFSTPSMRYRMLTVFS